MRRDAKLPEGTQNFPKGRKAPALVRRRERAIVVRFGLVSFVLPHTAGNTYGQPGAALFSIRSNSCPKAITALSCRVPLTLGAILFSQSRGVFPMESLGRRYDPSPCQGMPSTLLPQCRLQLGEWLQWTDEWLFKKSRFWRVSPHRSYS